MLYLKQCSICILSTTADFQFVHRYVLCCCFPLPSEYAAVQHASSTETNKQQHCLVVCFPVQNNRVITRLQSRSLSLEVIFHWHWTENTGVIHHKIGRTTSGCLCYSVFISKPLSSKSGAWGWHLPIGQPLRQVLTVKKEIIKNSTLVLLAFVRCLGGSLNLMTGFWEA